MVFKLGSFQLEQYRDTQEHNCVAVPHVANEKENCRIVFRYSVLVKGPLHFLLLKLLVCF